jgi:hypothetical protein
LVTDALVKHRDGIVGTWQPAVPIAPRLGLDSPADLKRWEPWVRAALFDFELLSTCTSPSSRTAQTFQAPTPNRSPSGTSRPRRVRRPPLRPQPCQLCAPHRSYLRGPPSWSRATPICEKTGRPRSWLNWAADRVLELDIQLHPTARDTPSS